MRNYLLLVSHGTMAPGVHSVMRMLFGERDDLLSTSLQDGMSQQAYEDAVRATLAPVTPGDRLFVCADIIGGSPLTGALAVIDGLGLLGVTRAFGGLNLGMVIAAVNEGFDAGLDPDGIARAALEGARACVREFPLDSDADHEAQDDEDL